LLCQQLCIVYIPCLYLTVVKKPTMKVGLVFPSLGIKLFGQK
jgi:hypothetical protein